jgi:hypothetical protein
VDRLQTRILNIFAADPYPRHTNLEQFQAIDSFVAVGVGPLDYGNEFVEKGPPHELLKGDLKFTAECIELVCPPLHISHPKEKHIFNEFLKANPSPTGTQWRELARLFKLRADYEHTFPKLPTMLKQHYMQWKDNQLIVMAELKMRQPYNALLVQLAQPTSRMMNPAVQLQNKVERALADGRPDLPLGDAPSNPLPVRDRHMPLWARMRTSHHSRSRFLLVAVGDAATGDIVTNGLMNVVVTLRARASKSEMVTSYCQVSWTKAR